MVYTNKGNSNSSIKEPKSSSIKNLGDCILENSCLELSQLAGDIYRLYIQFCAEGHLATREQYDEDERKRQCDLVVHEAAVRFFAGIMPEVVTGLDNDGKWEPIPDAAEVAVRGLYADAFMMYLEGLPFAMAIFSADEYESDEPECIEAIEAIYVDKSTVVDLGFSNEDVAVYLEMLITEVIDKRFSPSDDGLYRRPAVTIAKRQEGYFRQLEEIYFWGRSENGQGYVDFN